MTDASNPLLHDSALPFGVPDYPAIRPEHYRPAFDEALARHRDEVEAIASSGEAPTFANTIEALERAGALLDRVARAFFTVSSADATAEIQEIDEELAPVLAEHRDALTLDPRLFERIARVHGDLEAGRLADLTPEQERLIRRRAAEMTHAGAALSDEDRESLRSLNQRLSTLTTAFEKNLLADTNDLALHVDTADELAGLSAGELSAAAEAARERGLGGGYLVTLRLYSGHPYLASLVDAATRERLMAASLARGRRGNAHDNGAVLLEIVRLRARRAALLGHPTHAEYVASDETAGSAGAVQELLRRLAPPTSANADREQEALQSLRRADRSDAPFRASDWAFFTERVRTAAYDIDHAALRPYFEAERVLQDGVFFAAEQLYGVTFTERPDVPTYHPQARLFEVKNPDGSVLGAYILDLYTRDTKRGGAWMNSLVAQSALRGTDPVVVNNLNVPRPAPGTPTLLSMDDVSTLFHEFGHALHGLFARVAYPHFAGTQVHRDFVEFPSQVNEMWMLDDTVLANYARHVETGEPLPPHLVERLRASETFNQGFTTSEYLQAAWLDQAWHSLTADEAEADIDVAAFEEAALQEIGLYDPVIPPRYSSTYFAHVFSGGYSAGYYSYIWSEVLDADTVEWFRENGGLTRANGDRFRERLLGVGGAKDPLEAYRDFRGRDAAIEPLLERRGLA